MRASKIKSFLIMAVFIAGNAVGFVGTGVLSVKPSESSKLVELSIAEPQTYSVSPSILEHTELMTKEYAARDLMSIFGVEREVARNVVKWVFEAKNIHKTNLPLDLIFSIIEVESSFKYDAVSSSGAVSLMQVKPQYWASVCSGDLMNPKDNIYCGVSILDEYVKLCNGDIDCGIQSYNVGPTGFYDPENAAAKDRYLNKVKKARQKLADSIAML